MSLDKQIEHIRKTHASAQPRRENISWWNTHNDLTVALNRIAELEAQIEAARKDAERHENALEKLRQWAQAYPLEVFPEPDFKKAHEVLKANGISLSAISAFNMRHVITKVVEIVDAALEATTPEKRG